MNAYARIPKAAAAPKIAPLTSADIDRLFKRKRGWFDRARTRSRLYDKGFPHPYEPGRWSNIAVAAWFAQAGSNPSGEQPKAAKRPRRRRRSSSSNGYAAP